MKIWAPLVLSLLMGCTTGAEPGLLEATIVAPGNFIAGSGIIDSVGVLPRKRKPGTGADATGEHPDRNLYRLYVRMDAGGFQTVDIDSGRFIAGEAIELTNDGRVVRVSGTSLNEALRR